MQKNLLNNYKLSSKETDITISHTLGTTLNWYNFFLYVFFGLFFGEKIFGYQMNFEGIYSSILIVSISLFFMPISTFIGIFSDKFGRKNIFIGNSLILGLSTAMISIISTYEHFVLISSVAIFLIRILQGITMNADETNSTVHMKESMDKKSFFIYSGALNIAPLLGFVLSLLTVIVLKDILVTKDVISWGWKLPFLFSIITMSLSIYMKVRLEESDRFKEIKMKAELSSDVWKETKANISTIIKATVSFNIFNYLALYCSTFYLYYYLNVLLMIEEKKILELLTLPLLVSILISMFLGKALIKTKVTILIPISIILFSLMSYLTFIRINDNLNPNLQKALLIKEVVLERQKDCIGQCLEFQNILNKNKINFKLKINEKMKESSPMKLYIDKEEIILNEKNIDNIDNSLKLFGLKSESRDNLTLQMLICGLFISFMLLKINSNYLNAYLFEVRNASTSLNLLNGISSFVAGLIFLVGLWGYILKGNDLIMAMSIIPMVGILSLLFFLAFIRKNMIKE